MKFTIGTISNSIDLQDDMKLIKSSILYADEIELIGLVEYALYKYLPCTVFGNEELDVLIPAMCSFLQSIEIGDQDEILRELQSAELTLQKYAPSLKKKKHRSKQEILAQMRLKQVEKECKGQFEIAMQQILSTSESQALRDWIKRGIVSVYDYGFKDFNVDKLTGGYFANLMNVMYNGTAYPLFDKQSGNLIQSVVKTNLLDIGNLDEHVLRHAGVASGILMTLPTLENATVDELLDLKKENIVPLNNFRSAMYQFSDEIKSLPWDINFQYDCIQLYNKEVVPRIQEINEVMTQTNVLKNLGSKVLADEECRKKAGCIAGGITTAITTSTNISSAFTAIKGLILMLGLAAVSAETVTGFLKIADLYNKAQAETKDNKGKAEKNVMYYYYLASKI